MKKEIQKMSESSSEEEIYEIIQEILPGWLLGAYTSYSTDYPHLTSNWNAICNQLKTQPQKIVVVANIPLDEKDGDKDIGPKLAICEILTVKGYMVRRTEEITPCLECNKAMPSSMVFNLLPKDGSMKLPGVWSTRCTTC